MKALVRPAVLAVITSFNRHQQLVDCLRSLDLASKIAKVDLLAVIVDSSDSAPILPERYESIHVLLSRTEGDLFWAESMQQGLKLGLAIKNWSHVLFLNEDVVLTPDSIRLMLAASESRGHSVIVGTCVSQDGRESYGAYKSFSRIFPLILRTQNDGSGEVDTFNGNIVLLEAKLSTYFEDSFKHYRHRRADIDLGLALSRAHVPMSRIPSFQGYCEPNAIYTLDPRSMGLRKFLSSALGPKGVPVREHLKFTKRNAGPFWVIFFGATYLRLASSIITRRRTSL